MKRIIINADDCGMSQQVDFCIDKAIRTGKITSTTIMANMNDFEGAAHLYQKYKDIISFGWHINLTEGKPLTQNQHLLDIGFFKETGSEVVFNGKSFWKRKLKKETRDGIKNELKAQYERLRDNGIDITHVDGHHHIQTAPSMMFLMPSIFSELKIERCRHINNYGVSMVSYVVRQLWSLPFKVRGIRMPDTLTSFATYYKRPNLRQGSVIELECHPGHPNEKYQKEMELLYNTDINKWDAHFITYGDI